MVKKRNDTIPVPKGDPTDRFTVPQSDVTHLQDLLHKYAAIPTWPRGLMILSLTVGLTVGPIYFTMMVLTPELTTFLDPTFIYANTSAIGLSVLAALASIPAVRKVKRKQMDFRGALLEASLAELQNLHRITTGRPLSLYFTELEKLEQKGNPDAMLVLAAHRLSENHLISYRRATELLPILLDHKKQPPYMLQETNRGTFLMVSPIFAFGFIAMALAFVNQTLALALSVLGFAIMAAVGVYDNMRAKNHPPLPYETSVLADLYLCGLGSRPVHNLKTRARAGDSQAAEYLRLIGQDAARQLGERTPLAQTRAKELEAHYQDQSAPLP